MTENRLEQALNNLKQTEQRLERLFVPGVMNSRAFKEERIRQLDLILARFKNSKLSRDESFFMRLIKQERRGLHIEQYPNPYLRLLVNLFKLVADAGRWIGRKLGEDRTDMDLGSVLSKHGFDSILPKVRTHRLERDQVFSIPYVKQISDKERIEYRLNFNTLENGKLFLKDFTAALHTAAKNKPESVLRIDIGRNSFTGEDAAALLAGRAIKTGPNNWALLDFNDKDQEGNNKTREIVVDYDLQHELGKLKVKEIKGEDEKFALLHRLERGMRVPVTLRNDGKDQVYFIQADPVRKGISIFESSDSSVIVAPIQRLNTSLRPQGERLGAKRYKLNGGEKRATKPKLKK